MRLSLPFCVASALIVSAIPAAAQELSQGPVRARILFEGQTQGRDGTARRVDIRLWIIAGHQRLAGLRFPFRGVVIAELRAGDLTTIIDGRRVERREGEIWSVPAGSMMQLQTEDDTAVVQTTLVEG